ncbi:MAG TPA: endonuclease/exonuclease/phosphatase family protein [Verrucomicrobiae bacterium]
MKTKLLDKSETTALAYNKHPRRNLGGCARRTALFGLISLLAAGAFGVLAGPLDVGGKKALKVYQANAYVGGPIEAPLALDPTDPNYEMNLLVTVTTVFGQILAADPPARMTALADEIAAQRPDVAALQELYTIATAPNTPTGAGDYTVAYDYLGLLTNALAAKGAHYQVVVVATESDVEVPMIASLQPFTLAWGRIIDHEAILVRTDLPPGYLQASNPQTGRFSIYPQVPLGGNIISIYRGWCSVDVFTRGERFRLICTHPHDESIPAIQRAEVVELLADLADVEMPVMIVGDLNSDPFNRNGTDSYSAFAEAGFKDTWATLHPDDLAGGLTWGHDPALADPGTEFVYRLDYVFYRGDRFAPTAFEILDPRISLTTPPLWPSDHKAIVATFFLGNPKSSNGKLPLRGQ